MGRHLLQSLAGPQEELRSYKAKEGWYSDKNQAGVKDDYLNGHLPLREDWMGR